MTTREKIIALARECEMSHHTLLIGNEIEAFYHKAQAEAFKAAAKWLDGMDDTSGLGDAIREMAKGES